LIDNDSLFHNEIVTLALKNFMWLGFHNENHIACFNSGLKYHSFKVPFEKQRIKANYLLITL
jgi:hypothetical protein